MGPVRSTTVAVPGEPGEHGAHLAACLGGDAPGRSGRRDDRLPRRAGEDIGQVGRVSAGQQTATRVVVVGGRQQVGRHLAAGLGMAPGEPAGGFVVDPGAEPAHQAFTDGGV